MSSEPTLGEATRRIEEVSRQLAALAAELGLDRDRVDKTYVRKDLFVSEQRAIVSRVADLEEADKAREKTAAETRRQFVFLVLATAIPAIVGLLLAVNNFLASGGSTP